MKIAMDFSCFIGALLVGLLSSALAEEHNVNYTHYRLPQNARPINYNLTLIVDMEKDTFEGSVEIQLHITAPTSFIVIHALDLTFVEASLRSFETYKENEVVLDHSYPEYDYWVLKLGKNIEPGIYSLLINYSAKYNGLFKLDASNDKKYIVANTQGVNARSILPCFDEPALKATFDLTVINSPVADYYALSNADIKDVIQDDRSLTTIFERTPPMSTSYFGLIITDLPYKKELVYQEGVGKPYELRIYANDSHLEHIDPLLQYLKEAMEFFAQYTGVAYPLPKLDIVAVLSYYNTRTAASLGLYVQHEIMARPSDKPLDIYALRQVMSYLAEIWFGNLVTPSWWGEFWLTSELSIFMGWKALFAIVPDLDIELAKYRAYTSVEETMLSYKGKYMEPLKRTIKAHEKTEDLVVEGQGFGLLMMAETVVNENNFKKAVSSYLKKHVYGTVTTSDLIEEVYAVYPDFNITNMMTSFSTNYNYPIVTLEKLENGSYVLKQRIFEESQLLKYNLPIGTWVIPVLIKTAEKSEWFWLKTSEYVIPNLKADWAIISANGFGYYQPTHSENLWLALANALQGDNEVLNSIERKKILKSLDYQIKNSLINPGIVFLVLRFMENETSMAMWDAALPTLNTLKRELKGDTLYGVMKYGRQLIKNYYQSINWTTDLIPYPLNNHYGQVFKFACACDLDDCLDFADAVYKAKKITFPYEMPNDNVFGIPRMKKLTDENVWREYWDEYEANPDKDLFQLLMTSKDREFLKKVLQRAASNDEQFISSARLSSNAVSFDPELIWELLRNEMARNDTTREYYAYINLLYGDADPEVFAAIYGSAIMEEFSKRTHGYRSVMYLIDAHNKIKWYTPVKKWLKENGYLESRPELMGLLPGQDFENYKE